MTGTFVDYALPTAAEIPSLRDRPHGDAVADELARRQGRRRGGHDRGDRRRSTNAVIDALRPLGVTYIDMPLTPMRIWQAIHTAGGPAATEQGKESASTGRARPAPDRPARPREVRMIPPEFDYAAPESLDDALKALAEGGEDAKLLAGGHSLLPLMKLRLAAPSLLVDLRKRARAARASSARTARWRIGAMTPPRRPAGQRRARHRRARRRRTIADQQVRNRGTIGGSLAHGDPASDLPTVLLAPEGTVTRHGRRAARRARSRRPTCSRTT